MSEFLHFFPNEGFRPARYLNDFIGPRMDCPLIVKAADDVYLAKFDPYAPLAGYAWGTWIPASPAPAAPQITAASLAGPIPGPSPWHPVTPSLPWWPVDPQTPVAPCCVIREPEPELPPIAPVPLPASAGLLIAAVAVLAWLRRRA